MQGVGAEVTESDSVPLTTCHLWWWVYMQLYPVDERMGAIDCIKSASRITAKLRKSTMVVVPYSHGKFYCLNSSVSPLNAHSMVQGCSAEYTAANWWAVYLHALHKSNINLDIYMDSSSVPFFKLTCILEILKYIVYIVNTFCEACMTYILLQAPKTNYSTYREGHIQCSASCYLISWKGTFEDQFWTNLVHSHRLTSSNKALSAGQASCPPSC